MWMKTRLGWVLGALAALGLLLSAGPVAAAGPITTFPAKATTTFGGTAITAQITIPAVAAPTTTPCYVARLVGHKWAVTVAPLTVVCAAGVQTWTVTPVAANLAKKAKATVVVKFVPVNPDGTRYTGTDAATVGVKSLQVKVNHHTGKPVGKPSPGAGQGNR